MIPTPKNSPYIKLRLFNQSIALLLSKNVLWTLLVLSLSILCLIVLSINIGSYQLSTFQVFDILLNQPEDVASDNIIWLFRFPRTLCAALVGAMMALSGAALQNVTRNTLADPSLVGISQGAALMVVSSMILFPDLDQSWRSLLAFSGSILVALLILVLSHSNKSSKPVRFILLGIGISAFLSAITTAFLTYGDIYRASAALAWLAGSIDAANWQDVSILSASALVLIPLLVLCSRAMGALRFGEQSAVCLGTRIHSTKYLLIGCSVALAATATSIVGPIGFIGLIAPHAARRLCRSSVVAHLLLSALLGALLVLAADLAGRSLIAPSQIPAGILTQIIGVPAFLYLLLKQKAHSAI
ncbi:MAG: hypothetical protein OFPI_03850 [Osedax symbiont Rs2]|nr:MAG: hypothetical protein OFPI_03850 [Osedax symbiont Rs2]